MAFSVSVNRAQVPTSCDMCEENTQLKWWCVQCKKYMCDKCEQIHQQFSVQHEIVDIKTASSLQDFQPQITRDNIPCQDHKAKMSCMFCESCDKPVCPDCLYTTHKKHDFVPIEKVLSKKIDKLKGIELQLSQDLEFLKEKVEQIKKTEIQCNSMLDETVTKIKQKEQSLKDMISKYSSDLQTEVENERKLIQNVFSELKFKTDKAEEKVLQNQNQILTALSSNQGSIIFTVFKESKVSKQDQNFQVPKTIKEFSPGDGTSPGLVGLFGSLQYINLPQGVISFEVINSYATNLPSINQIITVDEITAWMSSIHKVLQQVRLQDDKISTIKEIKSIIRDMALTRNNDILLSLWRKSDVKLLTQSGEIKPYLSVSPLQPRGIHVTSDNDVIVGIVEPKAGYTTTNKSTRAIVIYGVNGKQKQKFEHDTNKQRLFTEPYRITTNVNNDLVVIDSTSINTGRVVVVGREGELRWTYERNPQVNVRQPFNPCGIVTTSTGHIIVSDYKASTLHVLSRDGDILVCKGMEDMGIIYPYSLNIDRRGQLWIGCWAGGAESGAKLHIVKCLQ